MPATVSDLQPPSRITLLTHLVIIIAAWSAIFASRPSALTLRGEETRRARIAYEMIETGDFFVSRVQGVPEMGRPPLAEWAIAGSALIGDEMTPATIRMPAILASLLTALTLYAYMLRFATSYGAAAAALIYLTFGHVLQMGRIAETDSIFTAFTALALLGWHRLYVDGSAPWRAWVWGYGWAAVAVLSKSPQAAFYFVTVTFAYLLVRRDWRFLFAPGQLVGWAAFGLLFGAWAAGYCWTASFALLRESLFGQIAGRVAKEGFNYNHLWKFPLQMAGALLPWSLLLTRYADRRFIRGLGTARDAAAFCATAVVVTFPTVWFSWPAGPRHLMSIYPCFAVLAAIVVERALVADGATSLFRGWRVFMGFLATAATAAAIGLCAAPWLNVPKLRPFLPPTVVALAGAAFAIVTAVTIVYSLLLRDDVRQTALVRRRFAGVAAAAACLGLAYASIGVNAQMVTSEDHVAGMARLKNELPKDIELLSIGQVDNVFVYHYGEAIPVVEWRYVNTRTVPVGAYFAYDPSLSATLEPNFRWETITTFACDRNHHDVAQRPVIIGRRLPEQVVTADVGGTLRR